MFPSVARAGLLVVGVLLTLFGVARAVLHAGGWGAILLGVAIVAGLVFERRRYKPVEASAPLSGFEPTAERFMDPDTRRPVRVYTNRATGERRYVDDASSRSPGP